MQEAFTCYNYMHMSQKYSPMIEQYLEVKKAYEDAILFYRVGDFYEMFFEDAENASRELDLVLTGKNAGVEDRIPMCGVPHHSVTPYIQRLVNRGYKVAICEQLTDPKDSPKLVERDVIKVVTPGTIMNEIIDDKSSVYLASIHDYNYGYALSIVEMSTGENYIENIDHKDNVLLQTLLKWNVKEVVLSSDLKERIIKLLREEGLVISYCDEVNIKEEYKPLIEKINKEYDLITYGRMLNYLEATQKSMLAHLQVVEVESENDYLQLDYASLKNLELTKSLHETNKAITLWSFLDECKSAMGSRELKKWIEKPLLNREEIINRQDKIAWLIDNFMNRNSLMENFSRIYDLQRIIARIAMNSASPVDLQRLTKTLAVVPDILSLIESEEFKEYTQIDNLSDLYKELKDAFVDDPPVTMSDGGLFRDGYNAELDKAREIQRSGKDFIATLEAKEREKTGIKTLKVGYNKVFGYYIEISKAQAKLVDESWGYIRKQTLTNNERFISEELKEKEDEILHAEENAIRLEKQLYQNILDLIKTYLPRLQKLSKALAELDVYTSLSEVSANHQYKRPIFSDDVLNIKGGKHPILDDLLKDPKYVSNDINLDDEEFILLITGPNMGGKSTYMRQIALIVIMAQMGCYVPAEECEMPIFDKIFTRIGASDDIISGESTFMVEMKEANNALQSATENSLILFDELGRGTSTYDGMALAQAIIEHIATVTKAKTLFSTHYHELTTLSDSIECMKNVHVMVKENDDGVTFLYKIKDGPVGHSYGINVARLAGLPNSVIERAKGLQEELESKKQIVQQSFQFIEVEKEDKSMNKVRDILKNTDTDELTPKEALLLLSDLVEILDDKKDK